MAYKLFLDDVRNPIDCVTYMHQRIGLRTPVYLEEWMIVRDFYQFVRAIRLWGLPEVVSFDHDLGDQFYEEPPAGIEEYRAWSAAKAKRGKDGYDCASFLRAHCQVNKLPMPEWFVHSMNPAGAERIKNLLNTPL